MAMFIPLDFYVKEYEKSILESNYSFKYDYFSFSLFNVLGVYMKILLFVLVFINSLFAHSLVLDLFDNSDGTIQIVGGFNTGQNAAGALVKVESLVTGKILLSKRLPDESEITFKIPLEEYQVILDGGPGHTVIKKGIEPKGGFKKLVKKPIQKSIKKENSSFTLPILWGICIVFLFLILFFWIRNTNKLLKLLHNS
jgi:hypothetical protein